ncbi:GPW/gp25 family protein [Burkholderia plantarii]|uniref:GPW/gp25 family protein n=1 Tax=Burkholderia plantarii TaxID=41899 RepID=UPI00272D472B|nr:GPW/gp25 family protein [Burkholderia plantarii]WLE59278.1 GPW/gp25 family protein [Burkholderia plantarii]
MIGMNATTGRSLSGLDHLYQSIDKILTTPLATCVQRRAFGSELADLVDQPNNGAIRTRLYAAVATALMKFEPRLTLTRVQLVTDDATLDGAQVIDIEGYTTETGEPASTRINLSEGVA